MNEQTKAAEAKPHLTPIRPVVAVLATVVEFGGIERVLLNLFEYIGPYVALLPILFTRPEAMESVFFERLQHFSLPSQTIFVNGSALKYLNPVRNVFETVKLLKKWPIDLIHTHGYRADIIGLIASRQLRVPVVSTCHGFVPTNRRVRLYNRIDAMLLRRFDRVVAVSERMKRDLIQEGIAEERLTVVTNVVQLPVLPQGDKRAEARRRFGISPADLVFGFVGRLSEEKGLSYLLAAAGHLLERQQPWRLLIVGDGPQKVSLEAGVHRAGLAGHAIFAGFQNDTGYCYAAMDAFILPSLTEGTPMALLEAMAHGLPVIASAVGGVPAVLRNDDNGLLIMPGDPGALAQAMVRIGESRELRARLGAQARRSVLEAHDVSDWARQMWQVYLSTISGVRRVVACS